MKPNALHIVNSFEQGGTERQAVQLARLLTAHGRFRVRLACLNARGVLRHEAEALGLGEIREYPLTSFYDANFPRQLRRLARHLREQDITVVHTHDFYSNVFGMLAAASARVPARVASKRDIAGFRSPAQDFVERGSFRLAHRVVVNSEAVRAFLVRGGVPGGKIVTVYNGLDMSRVEPPAGCDPRAALTALGLPPARRLVTIVANTHHPVKDHAMFLRAARHVRDRVTDAAFVVAGEGPLLDGLRARAAELGLAHDVFFVGRCMRVAELLAVSDVCVLTSKAEGFSNSILEYMAAARPVVVTDAGGAREAVVEGETGFIVPPGDDAQMSERIALLLGDRERARRMGERGRRLVAEKFSCEAQLARTERVYENLIAASRKTARRGGAWGRQGNVGI